MANVEIKSNLKLYEWQLQVARELKTHWKGYFHVIKAKRQCGKSILLESLLLKTAIENKRTDSFMLSTTIEQARKVFNEIKEVLQGTPLYKKHNDLRLYIELRNQSCIYFKSAEQREALRGYTCNGIYCIDEAAYIPDDVFYKTLAWCNVSQAPIVICSTPAFKTGFFYKYYQMGWESDSKIISYDWSQFDTSVLLPEETLEMYRKQLPMPQFKTEFLGEFLDNEGGVFGSFDSVLNDNCTPDLNLYMGVDWATGVGGDETAICLFNSNKEMVRLWHFNDKDETQTVTFIVNLINEFKPLKCQVETNSIGQVFYGLLDKAIKAEKLPVMLLKFNTSNESKERLINNLQVAIQNGTVSLLNDSMLMLEMSMYQMKLTPSGKKAYNAANGYHDDLIIAMLLSFDCINKSNYIIR